MRFTIFDKMKDALRRKRAAQPSLRQVAPKPQYDVVIVDHGGHGIATAYYLAKQYGISNIAVLCKGEIGEGNAMSAVVRADYFRDGNSEFYSQNLKMWQDLRKEFGRDVKLNACGVMDLCHSSEQFDFFARRGNVIRAQGDRALLCDFGMVRDLVPNLNHNNPLLHNYGGLWQDNAGTANSHALAIQYASAADQLGVDFIMNCDVNGFVIKGGAIKGMETTRGKIMAGKVALAAGGDNLRIAEMAGITLPIVNQETVRLASEAVKPILNCVVKSGLADVQIYQSESSKLVLSSQTLNAEQLTAHAMEMFQQFGAAKITATYNLIVEETRDQSPIIDKLSVDGLYLSAGWIDGGHGAAPASGASFAHLIATEGSSGFAEKFRLDRFDRGEFLRE